MVTKGFTVALGSLAQEPQSVSCSFAIRISIALPVQSLDSTGYIGKKGWWAVPTLQGLTVFPLTFYIPSGMIDTAHGYAVKSILRGLAPH